MNTIFSIEFLNYLFGEHSPESSFPYIPMYIGVQMILCQVQHTILTGPVQNKKHSTYFPHYRGIIAGEEIWGKAHTPHYMEMSFNLNTLNIYILI